MILPICIAQQVKNLPAMQETLVQFLGWEDPLEEIGYPLQYSWVSLVTQMVKNPPAMCDTWVLSVGWEDPLEEGMESLWTEELVGSSPQGRRGRHD